MTQGELDKLTYQIIGAAIEVHKELGPGLLESVYHKCLMRELSLRNMPFTTEFIVPINYKGLYLDAELRCDLFVSNVLVIEIKTVETLLPVHEAQLLSYMKLLKAPKGLLLNFKCRNLFREGQKTFVNELFKQLTPK